MAIRVLICDDSAVMRAMLGDLVAHQPDMDVVGTAADAAAARELIRERDPDVLILDVELPGMDGLEFLARLMRLRPMPVVVISAAVARDPELARRARALGAAEVLPKPRAHTAEALEAYAADVGERIRSAYRAAPAALPSAVRRAAPDARRLPATSTPAPRRAAALAARTQPTRVVLIGASTGGTEAIKEVLQGLPADMPPILMVQHMPEMFTGSFARRLDGLCALRVKEAEHGEPLVSGMAYLAPGHSHLTLVRTPGGGYQCALSRTDPVNRHRPSVDVLFHSVAAEAGVGALGVLLTGMGKDGAQGLLALRRAGAWTIAQDRDSCVVWGMPREAVALNAACEVLPLGTIAAHVVQHVRGGIVHHSA